MARIQQIWPDGLRERIREAAGRRGVTDYTIAALELALKDETHPSQLVSPSSAAPANSGDRAPVGAASVGLAGGSGEPQASGPTFFKCPRGCSHWRPQSKHARCPICRSAVVPA